MTKLRFYKVIKKKNNTHKTIDYADRAYYKLISKAHTQAQSNFLKSLSLEQTKKILLATEYQ